MRAAHYCSRSRFRPSSQLVGTTMPSADFCRPVRIDHSTLSPDFETNGRSPEVSSTAFRTQPSDLQPVPLMDMGFAIIRPLARHRMPHIRFLFIGSRVCSTLLSDPASRRRRCASLSLHLHQVVKRTFTSKLSNMLGTRKSRRPQIRRSALRSSPLLFRSPTPNPQSLTPTKYYTPCRPAPCLPSRCGHPRPRRARNHRATPARWRFPFARFGWSR